MNRLSVFVSVLVLCAAGLGLTLRAEPAKKADAIPAGPTELTAALTDPANVDLEWKNAAAAVRGYLVEYTSDPRDEYVILAIVPKETTTFRHPDLAPLTPFFYRIRPFLGEASAVASATTGKIPSGSEAAALIDDTEPVIDTPDTATASKKRSLRRPPPAADATPNELTATLTTPISVALKWKDRASDEDGYLVEAASPGQTRFDVIAFLPPDTIGFTVPQLPPETDCRFRVRAFFYGPSSNVVDKLTGEAAPASAPKPNP